MKKSFFVGLSLIGATSTFCLFAQPGPAFEKPALDSAGVLNLLLQGDTNQTYTIDASADLLSWWRLSSGVASNGTMAFHYVPAAGSEQRFFRARQEQPLPLLNLTVAKDPFPRAITLVTPEAGGTFSVTNSDGLIYRLTIPTNAVVDPQAFTMTLVTNLANLPFTSGLLGAVLLGPDNLDLLQPAQFELIFPTNHPVDTQAAVGFVFDADGHDLRLIPATTETNRITLFIPALSGIGSSKATASELQQQARRHLPFGNTAAGTKAPLVKAADLHAATAKTGVLRFLAQCRPADQARADAIRSQLNLAEAVMLEDITLNPKLGKSVDIYRDFVTLNIDPYESEAEANCAVNQELIRAANDIYWIAYRFGPLKLSFTIPSLCRGSANCFQEIAQCCGLNSADPQGSAHDLAVVRTSSIAFGCPVSPADLQGAETACRLKWDGTFKFKETWHLETNIISQNTVESHYLDSRTDVILRALNLQPASHAGGTHALNGTLVGIIAGTYRKVDHNENLGCCGDGCYTDRDEDSAIAERLTVNMNMIWSPDTNAPCSSCSLALGAGPDEPVNADSTIQNIDVSSRRADNDCFKTTNIHPFTGVHSFWSAPLTVPSFDPKILALIYPAQNAFVTATQAGTDTSVTGRFDLTQRLDDGTVHVIAAEWNFTAKQ